MPCGEKENGTRLVIVLMLLVAVLTIAGPVAESEEEGFFSDLLYAVEVNGHFDRRAGFRTRDDPHEKTVSVEEARLQVELFTSFDWAELKYKGDAWADGVTERGDYESREIWLFSRPTDFLDVKVGRQVLTWGTGDLVFVNDLFPKDWQSFFIGRDREYLKAPSDAVKVSLFSDFANVDVVYTPQFDADRYIRGEYISYWNATLGRLAGRDAVLSADEPDRWFRDEELALRVYGNVDSYELALYGYRGFWKSPGGATAGGTAFFPKLNVYGASARGQVGPGIGNVELAYYHSVDDNRGSNPLVNNSEMRYLVGYNQELVRDLNASFQYYVEQMLHYGEYEGSAAGGALRDRERHVLTLQLTQLLLSQDLELTLSSYYSPSDRDAYFRPHIRYKFTDEVTLGVGANIFVGKDRRTFFAQFEENTNVYASIGCSF